MSISRLLLSLGLVVSLLLASVRGLDRVEPRPTAEDFREQLKRLERKNSTSTRLEAVKWFHRHAGVKSAPLAIAALDQCIRDDPDAEVRYAAIESRAMIAQKRQERCPLVIIEAMLDKDDLVSQIADGYAGQFQSFAPGSVEVLLRFARSEDANLRGNCLLHLARVAGKDKQVLEVIEKARHDKKFGVRHNAHVALFQATDNLAEFLTYIVRLQEDPDGVLGPVDASTEEGKREQTIRNLASLGSSLKVVAWSDQRADELAPALLKLLGAPSAALRRGAARLIGASAIKVNLAEIDWKKFLDPKEEPAKPPAKPERSKVAGHFEKLKASDRLRELRDNDPDTTVQAAASLALKRLASVSEKGPSP